MRMCGNCNQLKPITEFSKNKRRKDGLCLYCKQCMNERNKAYRDMNKDILNAKKKIYRLNHAEETREYSKQYKKRENVKQRLKVYNQQYISNRYKVDKVYRYKFQMRSNIYQSLKCAKYIGGIEKIIGCDYKQFTEHLKNTFYHNYGIEYTDKENVHIDHVKPLATAHSVEEVNQLCNYKNLQLLRAEDNYAKSSKEDWRL